MINVGTLKYIWLRYGLDMEEAGKKFFNTGQISCTT
jgi:hypothetical protein